jgi:DNA-binding MarR family transcriptional regulator
VRSKASAATDASRECGLFEISCVSFNLRKASRIVSRVYQKEMRDAPVKGPLFSLLATISRRGSTSITALANGIGLERTTLTRNLRVLEQRGYIQIRAVAANRKEVSLLPEGEVALRAALALWRQAQDKVVRALGEDRWNRMRADLTAAMALGVR